MPKTTGSPEIDLPEAQDTVAAKNTSVPGREAPDTAATRVQKFYPRHTFENHARVASRDAPAAAGQARPPGPPGPLDGSKGKDGTRKSDSAAPDHGKLRLRSFEEAAGGGPPDQISEHDPAWHDETPRAGGQTAEEGSWDTQPEEDGGADASNSSVVPGTPNTPGPPDTEAPEERPEGSPGDTASLIQKKIDQRLEALASQVREDAYQHGLADGQKKAEGHLRATLFEEGRRAGLAESGKHEMILLEKLAQTIDKALEKLQAQNLETQAGTVRLVEALFERLYPAIARRHGHLELKEFSEKFAALLEPEPHLLIRLPTVARSVKETLEKRFEARIAQGRLRLELDANLGPSDCRALWRAGEVIRSVDTIWEDVKKTVRECLTDLHSGAKLGTTAGQLLPTQVPGREKQA